MALKILSRGFIKPGDKKKKFDQITIKICGRPCSILFSSAKPLHEVCNNQMHEPQPITGILSDIDCSNIKIPNVPPSRPAFHHTYVPENLPSPTSSSWNRAYDNLQERKLLASMRDDDKNERAQDKYGEALAKFEERVEVARNKIDDKKREIAETFSVFTFYIYKDNLYYFNTADIHSEEDQKLIIKKYYVREQKKLEKFQKELEIIERLASETGISREPISESVRMFVWRRDGGQCVKCGSKENLEFDHIIPLSKGGSNTERNIQILCEHCNREKADKI